MQLKKGGFMNKLYLFNLGWWDNFKGGWGMEDYEERTNLCLLFRVSFIYPVLIVLLHLLAYATVAGAFLMPFYWFPVLSIGKILFYLLLGIGFVIGVCIFGYFLFEEHIYRKCETYRVIKDYAIAIDKRICPLVDFVDEVEEN